MSRIGKAYRDARVINWNEDSKIVILSDCHRGQGNWGDNFMPNQNLFFVALDFYYNNGFTYIELGDGDELWENRNMCNIVDCHSDSFWQMSRLYTDNRFYMVYGNHDIVKRNKDFVKEELCKCYNEVGRCHVEMFPDINVEEAIVLRNKEKNNEILLVHGHQVDPMNSTFWPISRFLVRYLWHPLEMIGFKAPIGGEGKQENKDTEDNKLINFAKENNIELIAGHTHRPYFSKENEGYYNVGSCVHPRCITAIEIVGDRKTLVKWTVMTRRNYDLYIERIILEES